MLHGIFKFFYPPLVLLLAGVLTPLFLFHPRGRLRLKERWGSGASLPQSFIWIHGASVGEVMGLLPIMRALRAEGVSLPIVLTSTSPSGLDRGALDADIVRLLPFDCSWLYQRFCGTSKPVFFIGAETELWPGLLSYLQKHSIPCICANAVISDFTADRYRMFSAIFRPLLKDVTVCCADEKSRDRFLSLGVPASSAVVTGSAKFDSLQDLPEETDATLRMYLSTQPGPILVFGSLRDGEEVDFSGLIPRFLSYDPNLCIILAPRHLEKIEVLLQALDAESVAYTRYSTLSASCDRESYDTRCLVLDVMGKLMDAYRHATLAYVGGSLHPGSGGHNPLEPARCKVPIAMGPHVEKQLVPVQYLQERNALESVSSPQALFQWVCEMLEDEERRIQTGEAAYEAFSQAIGATERTIAFIRPCLNHHLHDVLSEQEVVRSS